MAVPYKQGCPYDKGITRNKMEKLRQTKTKKPAEAGFFSSSNNQ
jgi:hypothetical protein